MAKPAVFVLHLSLFVDSPRKVISLLSQAHTQSNGISMSFLRVWTESYTMHFTVEYRSILAHVNNSSFFGICPRLRDIRPSIMVISLSRILMFEFVETTKHACVFCSAIGSEHILNNFLHFGKRFCSLRVPLLKANKAEMLKTTN